MLFNLWLTLTAIFLINTAILVAWNSAFRRVHRQDLLSTLNKLGGFFFYGPLHRYFFQKNECEGLFFSIIYTQYVSRFCSAICFILTLGNTELWQRAISMDGSHHGSWAGLVLIVVAFMLFTFIFADYLPRIIGSRHPEGTFKVCAPLASPLLFLAFPVTYLFSKLSNSLSGVHYLDLSYEPIGKEEIIELLQHADLSPAFDIHDRALIESVVQFKERIAREVMVPRVDLFSLPAETSIKDAAKLLQNEEYSRTPVYRNTVDNIVGVLMYKDILRKYMEYEASGNDIKILQAPIESIQKGVIHTPETKKLSTLLQEFRKKQLHLAIVVDEYGGTEGIVTIEDILEEIVGDIADEYDQEEELLFYSQADGSWVVDARMNILDAEEELGIEIPQEGEYDTIGGYIYHTTGSIPSRGFVIHHDKFNLEILKSNERSVEKVRIKTLTNG